MSEKRLVIAAWRGSPALADLPAALLISAVANPGGPVVTILVTSIFQDEPVGSGKDGCEGDNHGDRASFPLVSPQDGGGYEGDNRVDGKGVGTATASEERSRGEFVLPLFFAWIYIGLGDRDAAFDWLEKASRQRSFRIHLLVDPIYDSVRPHPRFGALLRRIGFSA
jgi:hypothetical protein